MDNFIDRVREMISKLNYLDGKKDSNLQILRRRIEEIRNRNKGASGSLRDSISQRS
jgi:hypothetical protein